MKLFSLLYSVLRLTCVYRIQKKNRELVQFVPRQEIDTIHSNLQKQHLETKLKGKRLNVSFMLKGR